jgi:hypothetical protein
MTMRAMTSLFAMLLIALVGCAKTDNADRYAAPMEQTPPAQPAPDEATTAPPPSDTGAMPPADQTTPPPEEQTTPPTTPPNQ